MIGDELRAVLGDALPSDHARQSNAPALLTDWLQRMPPHATIVDLGCGRGDTADLVLTLRPDTHWIGVDLADSPEVAERTRSDGERVRFETFDGVNIPLAEYGADMIYSHQVFEHVERPDPLLADVARVLVPGGVFCGSLSQAELFHSLSVTSGFTAYGWRLALERAGLVVEQIRPAVDGGTLLARRLMRRPQLIDRFFTGQSPGNRLIDLYGRLRRLDAAQVNAAKLLIAGHIAFVARRPA